jgi:signal peptidase II
MADISLRGPLSRFGLAAALAVLIVDQALKAWVLWVYDIVLNGPVRLTPFFDLVLVWNRGISYGLFPQDSRLGRWVLVLFVIVVIGLLAVWLAAAQTRLVALSLGLIIGGAAGNLVDRLIYGAVADFFHFHVYGYSWYVFNIADATIVAGVAGLLYDSFLGRHKRASKGD